MILSQLSLYWFFFNNFNFPRFLNLESKTNNQIQIYYIETQCGFMLIKGSDKPFSSSRERDEIYRNAEDELNHFTFTSKDMIWEGVSGEVQRESIIIMSVSFLFNGFQLSIAVENSINLNSLPQNYILIIACSWNSSK